MATKRYFIKCLACDQTFWLDSVETLVPEHGPWNRRVERQPRSERGCQGARQPGHWIGEDAAAGPSSPPAAPRRPSPDTSPEP